MAIIRTDCGPVLGLDLSLTASGVVIIPENWELCDWGALKFQVFGSKLSKDAEPHEVIGRLRSIAESIVAFATEHGAEYAFTEGYAYGAQGQSHYQLAELGGAVRVLLAQRRLIVQVVASNTARSYLMGSLLKGIERKDHKAEAGKALRSAGLILDTLDKYDAFIVANAGLGCVLGKVGISFA